MNEADSYEALFGIGRRDFVRTLALAIAALEGGARPALGSETTSRPPRDQLRVQEDAVIGIQMGPHTMLDEGIEPCLDLIQETAAINAVFTYTHSFHADLRKPIQYLATDHGTLPRAPREPLPSIWVRHHDEYFRDTRLRTRPTDPSLEYADRDLFSEMAEPARRRGMKVYARILESSGRAIENFDLAVTVDVFGRPTRVGCWRNPDYLNFWRGVAEDLFRTYDLDGFQWGAERMGPLMNMILPWNDTPPTCFCEHCVTNGRAAGIDAERAREGYSSLYTWVRGQIDGQPKPAEGVITMFARHIIRYPEILAWEYQYRLGREAVMRAMHDAIKAVRPDARVGWHVDHQPSSWDLVYRAEMSYEEMAPYSDFIKFIAYHDVLGPRIRNWYLERFQRTILSELSLEQSLALYYAVFGYDPAVEPGVDALETQGFSPDYVYRETRRSVASANGATMIYPGIGFDVPWGNRTMPADPEEVYEATMRAFEGGASGIVVSREYEEMKLPNLRAVGRAVRELK